MRMNGATVAPRASDTSDNRPFLSQEQCMALYQRIVSLGSGGDTHISVITRWTGTLRWTRNRISVASDTRTTELSVWRTIRGARGYATTTRLDDDGLRDVIRAAERWAGYVGEQFEDLEAPFIDEPILHPVLWSDATYGMTADQRTDTVRELIAPTESAGFVSAGTLQIAADGRATIGSSGIARYYPTTSVEGSVTVRDAHGTMSGWAGVNDYDVGRVDLAALAARALDKCQRSTNAVVVEPGRHTVILEPQAVCDLFTPVIYAAMERVPAEMGMGPFAAGGGDSKIGQRLLDPRISVRADAMDPMGGFVPFDQESGAPYYPAPWFQRGVLTNLAYNRSYALARLGTDRGMLNPRSYHMTGGTTSIDEMIAATQRGFLVTRLHDVRIIDFNSALCSGYTRDGLWLIESGKIVKAVKNFRFTESPLFVLNNVADLGVPVRVFTPGRAVVVPPMRVRDFNFSALSGAV
jgi:predicted Zn-dependent protease